MHAWIRHAGGFASLVSCRGPFAFNSAFEIAMFQAHTPPIVRPFFARSFSQSVFLILDILAGRCHHVKQALLPGDPRLERRNNPHESAVTWF